MMTVTYLSPRRVWRHTCSSTPRTLTPLKRASSLIKTLRPSSRTAVFAVDQATPRASAIRDIDRCATTRPSNAHLNAVLVSFARGAAAADRS